jgi:hypothetical protein
MFLTVHRRRFIPRSSAQKGVIFGERVLFHRESVKTATSIEKKLQSPFSCPRQQVKDETDCTKATSRA